MDFFKKNKIAIGGGIILALGVYYYITNFSGSEAPLLTSSADSPALQASQTLLTTLNSLHTIKLDNTIFQDPVFTSLTDFGVSITPQPVGRRNPFLPYVGSVVFEPPVEATSTGKSPVRR